MATMQTETDKNPLSYIIGEKLSAVTFVQDYVQLQFDGPILTLLNWPAIEIESVLIRIGMTGYRDSLCERIGKHVCGASAIENREIRIKFVDSSSIVISLDPENYCGA